MQFNEKRTGTMVPQAVITAHIQLANNESRSREEPHLWMNDNKRMRLGKKKIGSYIQTTVDEYDVMVSMVDPNNRSLDFCYSSFAGLAVPERVESQRQFELSHVFHGICKVATGAGPLQNGGRHAVYAGGSTSTRNYTGKAIPAGTRLRLQLPPINQEELTEYRKYFKADSYNVDIKIPAKFVPLEYGHITSYLELIYSHASNDAIKSIGAPSDGYDALEYIEAGSQLATQATLTSMLATVVFLVNAGIVVINPGLNPKDAAKYKLNDLKKDYIVPNGPAAAVVPTPRDAGFYNTMNAGLLTVATALGLEDLDGKIGISNLGKAAVAYVSGKEMMPSFISATNAPPAAVVVNAASSAKKLLKNSWYTYSANIVQVYADYESSVKGISMTPSSKTAGARIDLLLTR